MRVGQAAFRPSGFTLYPDPQNLQSVVGLNEADIQNPQQLFQYREQAREAWLQLRFDVLGVVAGFALGKGLALPLLSKPELGPL